MKNQAIKKRIANIKAASSGPEIADLVRARRAAGVSQAVMATRAGVSGYTIFQFEHHRNVRVSTAKKIRSAYSVLIKDPELEAYGGSGNLDAAWLKKQTENFLRLNSVGFCEKEKIAHFVLSSASVYEFGRLVLIAAGRNVD